MGFNLNHKQESVIHSLMPKGVEHLLSEESAAGLESDPFVDAERR